MKNEITYVDMQYVDAENEAFIKDFKSNLFSTVGLQGEQDGIIGIPNTEVEYRASILLTVETKVQSVIDRNAARYLPISGLAYAKIIESEAIKKILGIRNQVFTDRHTLLTLERELRALRPDKKLILTRKIVKAGLVVMSLLEGLMSYTPFRHAGCTQFTASVAIVGVAVVVGLASHISGGYIKRAKTQKQWITRFILMLLVAVPGFLYLGYLRAKAINYVPQYAANSYDVAPAGHANASALALAVISILIYAVGLAAAAVFFRTTEERLKEQAYEDKQKEVKALVDSIENKEQEIVAIGKEKVAQMTLALARYEYAVSQERGLLALANEAAETYKQMNRLHRVDGCIPVFFGYRPQFNFITYFSNVKNYTNEKDHYTVTS